MVSLRTTIRVLFQFGSTLKLLYGSRVFALHQEGITQIIYSLRIAVVAFQRLAIAGFRFSIIASPELSIALSDIVAVGLRLHVERSRKKQEQEHHGFLSAEEVKPAEMRIANLKDTDFYDQQEHDEDGNRLKLFVEIAIDSYSCFLLREFVEFCVELLLRVGIVFHVNIGSASSFSHLFTHIFIQSRHDGLPCFVFDVIVTAADGDRRSFRRSYAKNKHTHAFVFCLTCSLKRPTLMVFSIGYHDDGLANTLFLRKTVCCHFNGGSKVGTLYINHRGIDIAQKHFCRNVVARNRQLHKGVAGKYDQSDLVVGEMVNKVFYHHFGSVETTWCHIFRQHRIGNIHGDDGFNTRSLLMVDLGTHLRTRQHHDHERQGCNQQYEFHPWTMARNVGHQLAYEIDIAKSSEAFLLLIHHPELHQHQNRYQYQQIEIYGVFKSKHNAVLR